MAVSFSSARISCQPTGILREAKIDARETQRLAELRTKLIDRGYFLAGGLLGCLSTQTTHDHVDGLCEALTELLPAVVLQTG